MTAGTEDGRQKDWLMLARPAGEPGPFREYHAGAASPEKAAEILQGRGLEVQLSSARIRHESDPPEESGASPHSGTAQQHPGPLRCSKCSYLLTDLKLEGSSVVCPECSHRQRLITWPLSFDDRWLLNEEYAGFSGLMYAASTAIGVAFVGILLITIVIAIGNAFFGQP